MKTTVQRLAIALTSATAIVAAFSLAATPPTVEAAPAPATGTSVVIDLTDQHTAGAPGEEITAAWRAGSKDC